MVRAVGCVLLVLGILMLAAPNIAVPLFGATTSPETNATYIRAIAVRDIAIGCWLIAGPSVSAAGTTVSIAAISLIPCGDLFLVWSAGGELLSLFPHILSLITLLALAAWGSCIVRPADTPGSYDPVQEQRAQNRRLSAPRR
jgi:hypothetical protein